MAPSQGEVRPEEGALTGLKRDNLMQGLRQMAGLCEEMKTLGNEMPMSEHGTGKTKTATALDWLLFDSAEELKGKYGEKHWRVRVVKFVQSPRVETIFLIMLLVDVVIVVGELFLNAEFPPCEVVQRIAVSCCPTELSLGEGAGHSLRLLSAQSHESACSEGFEDHVAKVSCMDNEAAHTVHYVLGYLSNLVLVLFELELFTLLVSMERYFFRQKLYVMDLFVVTASLTAAILAEVLHVNSNAATIIMLGRGWRFVRVIHGLVTSTQEEDMKKLEKVQEGIREWSERFQSAMKDLSSLEQTLHLEQLSKRDDPTGGGAGKQDSQEALQL